MNDIIRISNLKGKQEDISIFEITGGMRIITQEQINEAPMIMLEVFKKTNLF
jgi:hypothetical protein